MTDIINRTDNTNSGMYAIRTRFVPATDTEGACIKAEMAEADPSREPSVTAGYDHSLDGPGNHAAAAVALADHMKSLERWHEDISLVQGAYGEDGYVFVLRWA